MLSWWTVGIEVTALGAVTASLPLRFLVRRGPFDADAPHPTPVVLAHGFLGDPTNFLVLQRALAARGFPNFAPFAYAPTLDYQRVARRLGRLVEELCQASGLAAVDVLGHSLGGLAARYLVEMEPTCRVRRLVTLGSPYFASARPVQELAVLAASDPFVPAPDPTDGRHAARGRGGRVVVVPRCGHWGLLYHPTVLGEVASFLGAADVADAPPLALRVS